MVSKNLFFCKDCGNEQSRWSGQCPDCGEWNTLTESTRVTGSKKFKEPIASAVEVATQEPLLASEITADQWQRQTTGSKELDRVLGGGLVQGSVVLVGGDPGIGKSTLLTQVAANMGSTLTVMYASGEESMSQISVRAARLNLKLDSLWLYSSNVLEDIELVVMQRQCKLLIIDSIQTIYSSNIDSAQGSVSQVRECCARLVRMAKNTGMSIFIVGHVTKEGTIAGPRVLEHMVDTVLYFEGEQYGRFRVIRAFKNRFGCINELGVFAMTESGLKQVKNPSSIFLTDRVKNGSGSIVTIAVEGSRSLLLEIQALVDENQTGMPRRVAVGPDSQRMNMLLTILNKHGKISCNGQDVYVNVPGGIKLQEPSIDLPLLLAVSSSIIDSPIGPEIAAFGEIGLSGEIRPVPNGDQRIREASKQGFKTIILASSNVPRNAVEGVELIAVKHIQQALQYLKKS